jgi:hypothetical protein
MYPLEQRKACCQEYKRLGFHFGNPLKPAARCADGIFGENEKPTVQDASERAQNSRNEVAEAASNCLTRHLILVYSRGCCNVFKDLSGSKMSFFPFERGLVFEASSSYKNMYDEIFII